MKKYLLPVIFLSVIPVAGFAQEVADSVSAPVDSASFQMLDEVVVEGRTQRVIKHGVEYIPDKQIRKNALDATSLLRMMNIPQLNIPASGGEITTVAGKSVSVFIDYMPADSQDLEGLRPEDVLRVEVLQYPDDPRFNSAPYVVNYIMRRYEWGGYSKLSATGCTLADDALNGLLYSKFVTGYWTFDASVQGSVLHSDRGDRYSSETFRDIEVGGRHIDRLSRQSTSGDGYLRQNNSEGVSVRAVYNPANMQITHTLSFLRTAVPKVRDISAVNFSDDILPSAEALSIMSSQMLSPAIRGRYYFALPKGNSLVASWSFGYGSTRSKSTYRLGGLDPIINNNAEESYSPTMNISYSQKFSHNNTFRAALMTYNSIYRTRYAGSYDGTQRLLSSETMLFLEYMQNWAFGLSLYSRLGVSYVVGRVNGVNTLEQWNPRLGAQLEYTPGEHHSFSLEGWWGNSHPSPSSANSAIVQSDELLWLQGNPDLKNTLFTQATASYTYMPTNRLSLSVAAEYEGNPDKQATEYRLLPGHDGLVRRQINSGDAHRYSAWVAASLKLFNNSLVLRSQLSAERVVLTGIDSQSQNRLSANVQATYSFRNFTLIGYYDSPHKMLDAWSNGVSRHYKSTYGINLAYSAGDFRAAVQFDNWFSKGRLYEHFDSAHYSSYNWSWNASLARSLNVTLTYTLPYGKKVNRNNELNISAGSGSAILK